MNWQKIAKKIYPSWSAKVWLINTARTRYVHCKGEKYSEWEMTWARQWPRGQGEGVESRWRPALVLPQQPWLHHIHHTDCIALASCLPQDWSQNLTLHLKKCISPSFPSLFSLFATVLSTPLHIHLTFISPTSQSRLQSYFQSVFFPPHMTPSADFSLLFSPLFLFYYPDTHLLFVTLFTVTVWHHYLKHLHFPKPVHTHVSPMLWYCWNLTCML